MIIKATYKDVTTILKLHKETLPHDNECKLDHNKNYIRNTIKYKHRYLLKVHNQIIGSMHYYTTKNTIWLNTIAIFKKYQKHHHGKTMMKFIEKIAQHKHKNIVLYAINKRNYPFYKKLGYMQDPKYKSKNHQYKKFVKIIK